jgi:hypothetical protein
MIIAKSLGYSTILHYSSLQYRISELSREKNELKKGIDGEGKTYYYREINPFDQLLVAAGGPLQTIITGTFGVFLILIRIKVIEKYGLKMLDWFAVFLSLFWLRQVFNLLVIIGIRLISSEGSFFEGDEKKISMLLNFWPGTLSIFLGTIGIFISLYIVFRVIPENLRFTFILSGLIGGITGFVFWMDVLGPKILP